MAYLRSLTASSGEVRYSRTSRQTPVWVTAQAVMALARKPLPFAPVPRPRQATPAAAAATPAPAATPRPKPAAASRPKPRATATATPAPVVSRRDAYGIGLAAGAILAAVL